MPDVSLVVRDLKDAGEAERLERALTRLSFVNLVNVDSEKGLVALSYEGGAAELERIEQAVTDAGHDFELWSRRDIGRGEEEFVKQRAVGNAA